MVEIAKALARKPRILILDEATSALTAADVAKVFAVLKRLRSEGLALLYISHRMHEIAELADDCTVFRNGRNVATYKAGTKTDNEVVELMIGREYSHVFPPKPAAVAEPASRRCSNAATSAGPTGCATSRSPVGAGEVVGLGGLDGQGQRELLLAFFGVLRGCSGEVLIDGKPVDDHQPGARAHGAQDRHGADPRGSQDRRADAADDGARQPLLRRARPAVQRRHHRPRRRGAADRRDGQAARPSGRPGSTSRSARCRAATSRRW